MAKIAGAILVLALLMPAGPLRAQQYRATVRLDVPGAGFAVPNQLRALEAEIEQKRWPDAAARLEAISREHADEMVGAEAGQMAMSAWVDALPAEPRAAVTTEYNKQFDPAARQALDALRGNPGVRPEEFYQLARSYPLTTTAADALLAAGDRAAKMGDPASVVSFYGMAQQRGTALDDERATMLALCRLLTGQPVGALSPEVAKRLAAVAPEPAKGYRGPLPFDAAWYGRPEAVFMSRYMPVAADGVTYINALRHVLAIKDNGQVLWAYQGPQAAAFNPDRPAGAGRGILFQPALFIGQGGPAIIIVRQLHGQNRDHCLRAIRATDGKLLWSTEANSGMDNVAVLSAPAVAGQYVYCVGAEFAAGNQPPSLVAVALDLMDGRLLWKTSLGIAVGMQRSRQDTPAWDSFAEQSAPAVADELLVLTPNAGWAFAIGRFDGKLRWAVPYAKPGAEVPRVAHKPSTRPYTPPAKNHPPHVMRWTNTPQVAGQTVVAAPQDMPLAFACNLRTGKLLWADEAPEPAAPTLIGHSEQRAIFAGDRLQALDLSTGQVRGEWEPRAGQSISGPPAQVGDMLYVPTPEKIVALSAADFSPAEPKTKLPNFRLTAAADIPRRALEEAQVYKSFGLPRR